MISAIIKGKTEVEDKITSSVFDNLLHLPDEMLWSIIRSSCFDNYDLPINAGDLLDHEFWTHWDKKNTGNKNFVEPDLFLRFENIDIIIEAKRDEYNKQVKSQWKKEIIAYLNEHGYNKNVVLLGIDGIENERKEEIKIKNVIIYVYKTRWKKIYSIIKRSINEMNNVKDNNVNNVIRILSLLKDFMIHYGYIEETWINELLIKEIIFTNIMDSITMLKSDVITIQCENNWFKDMFGKNLNIDNKSIKYIKRLGV